MRISYGPFSYYTGGDLSGELLDEKGSPVDIEEKVAKICGAVDVCKANHHAYKDAMTEGFLKHIKASAYIIPVWDYEHIQPSVMKRMAYQSYSNSDIKIFPTRFPEILREKYASEKWVRSVSKDDGHIVIKVYDNGEKYKLYIISALDEKQIVKNVFGPFISKTNNN